jgi:hypothetical protein
VRREGRGEEWEVRDSWIGELRDYRIAAARIFGENAICSVGRCEACAKRGLRIPEDIGLLQWREAITKGVRALILRARLARWKQNLLASGRNQRCCHRGHTPQLVVCLPRPVFLQAWLPHEPDDTSEESPF